ncbi:ImmA/IrrE family metallo-endopeptidase [Monashia sp. NPDC004114]
MSALTPTGDPEADGLQAARAIRADLGLGSAPIGDMVALVERLGHDVVVMPAPNDEHGYSVFDPQRGHVIIGVATTENPMRQRASLAHELGHVIFRDWGEPGSTAIGGFDIAEARARAHARHMLVPREGLFEITKGQLVDDTHTLSDIVQWFLASPDIVRHALKGAELITPARFAQWSKITTPGLAARYGWVDQYEALSADSQRARAPQRLLARAVMAYEAGVLSAEAVARVRGLPVADAVARLEAEGIVQRRLEVPFVSADELPDPGVDLDELDALLGERDERDG